MRAGMGKHLAPAILSLSGSYPTRTCYRFMGWTQIDERWTYVSPGVCVNAEGKIENPPEVELDARLRDYGLQDADWDDCLSAFEAMIPVFPKQLAPACIAFALLPLVQRFFPTAAPRPAIHLAGTYGSGKSELAALMSSFYGTFSRDTPPAQWGDTINTVEAMGYPLANALYWVDDYKSIYADERTFTRFLQSYSRGMGRGRLTREAKLRQERPCRGLVLSTGETVLEGEASVLSRMLVLDVPPWEHRDPGGLLLAQADLLRQHLSGFTVQFAAWIAQQVEEHDLIADISRRFTNNVNGYRKKLAALGGSQANTGRIIQNWAVLVTVYQLLRKFLETHEADEAAARLAGCDPGNRADRAPGARQRGVSGFAGPVASRWSSCSGWKHAHPARIRSWYDDRWLPGWRIYLSAARNCLPRNHQGAAASLHHNSDWCPAERRRFAASRRKQLNCAAAGSRQSDAFLATQVGNLGL